MHRHATTEAAADHDDPSRVDVRPGGWAFQYNNDHYPDLDDTAVVVMAMDRAAGLRGDTDALPLHEDTGLDYASETQGAMHACGHDTHVAMLVGAARLLCAKRESLPGTVMFMFQPGEEGHHGARYMLDEGLLDVGAHPIDGSPSPVTGAFAISTSFTLLRLKTSKYPVSTQMRFDPAG